MAEEKKEITAHEAAIGLLGENPSEHLSTIAALYVLGTKVPAEAIPALKTALTDAYASVKEKQQTEQSRLGVRMECVMAVLGRQEEEAKRDKE